MTGGGGRVPTADEVVREALRRAAEEPDVQRAGLALSEGGGRRLRFTASDRHGTTVDWCHIDAYDDVPLTLVVRTGENVAGTLPELASMFPVFVDRQAGTATAAVVAVPLALHGQVLGGVLAYAGRADLADLQLRLAARAAELAEALRVAQLRTPREGRALAEEELPEGARVADTTVEGHPRAVGEARRFVRRALAEWEVPDDLSDTAVLCLSEIVTNAVVHTAATSELRVSLDGGVLTVTVRDQGSHHGERLEPAATVDDDPLRVHGRGLQLVDALAARWGSELDAVGTTVWFVLEVA